MRAFERLEDASRAVGRLPRRRKHIAWPVAFAGPLLVAAAERALGSSIPPATTLFITLLIVVFVALIGGARPSVAAVGVAVVSQEVLFSFPYGSLNDRHPAQISVLVVFVVVGVGIGGLVDELASITAEQAALRRIATLVALGKPPPEVLDRVASEVVVLLGADVALVAHLETDDHMTLVAVGGQAGGLLVGQRLQAEATTVLGKVMQTGRAARIDVHGEAWPDLQERHRLGVRSSVATPITVDGRLWGVVVAASRRSRLAARSEQRMLRFMELVATAIANAESRSELTASRARIVAASDATRRRLERDLHDGVQQRLVSLALNVRAAQSALPPATDGVRGDLGDIVDGLSDALEALREIARGIHPAILSEGGLEPALKTLARRAPVPMTIAIRIDEDIPDGIAVAAYYSISELVTNTAKHASASGFAVDVSASDAFLRIAARDDGVGGADPARGSGLVGLRDRIEALGGSIVVRSPAGAGTAVDVELPLAR